MAEISSAQKPGELTDEELERALRAALADNDSGSGTYGLALSFHDAVCADDELMEAILETTTEWLEHVAVTGGVDAERADEIDDAYDHVRDVTGASWIGTGIALTFGGDHSRDLIPALAARVVVIAGGASATIGSLEEAFREDPVVAFARADNAERATLTRDAGDVLSILSTAPRRIARTAVSLYLAQDQTVPPEMLVSLAADAHSRVRLLAASNCSTPPEALVSLAADTNSGVRRLTALNPSSPPEVLVSLAADADPQLRARVADNRSVSPELLASLAGDPDSLVRSRVARNSATPPGTLSVLAASDDSEAVRCAAAKNPSTPT